MGNSASQPRIAKCEAGVLEPPKLNPAAMDNLGLNDVATTSAAGVDDLPDLSDMPELAAESITASQLPSPGKIDNIAREANSILKPQTFEGMTFAYNKAASGNPAGTLLMMHNLQMGPEGEGYSVGAMYQSQKYIFQGLTDRNFGLQGMAIINDTLGLSGLTTTVR
jgi:hypothetical protein